MYAASTTTGTPCSCARSATSASGPRAVPAVEVRRMEDAGDSFERREVAFDDVRAGHARAAVVLVAVPGLHEHERAHARGRRQLLHQAPVGARHARADRERDARGGAGHDARRLDAEQLGDPLAAPVEELRHRGERPVHLVHRVADGGGEHRAAEVGVDARGVDHRADAQHAVDALDRPTVQQSRGYAVCNLQFKQVAVVPTAASRARGAPRRRRSRR